MTSTRFNPEKDIAPMPFDKKICHRALDMKKNGLIWQPHVGCFVWDPDEFIKPASPFPGRIYFILSLARFIEIFDTIDQIAAKLVWLPTLHQARLVGRQLGITDESFENRRQRELMSSSPVEELLQIYGLIIETLKQGNPNPDKPKLKTMTALNNQESALEKLYNAAIERRLGDISGLPQELVAYVLKVYREFIASYLNMLRQRENKPTGWTPENLVIESELTDGMRHFFSDYQHIAREFNLLNQEMDRLLKIDKESQPHLFRHTIEEILQGSDR